MICKDCINYKNCNLLFDTKKEEVADDCDEYMPKNCADCFDFPEDCKKCENEQEKAE